MVLLVLGAALPIAAYAGQYDDFAVVSSTMGVSASRVCIGEGTRGDIGCPTWAPYVAVDGTVSATNFVGNGSGLTNLSAGDRITSGTASITANSATSIISLTTGNTTWGYLGSAASYLPNLSSNAVSSTNISVSTINGVSASNFGISKLVSLTDVSATSPIYGAVLQYDGTKWNAVSTSALISGSQVAFSVTKGGTDQTVTAHTLTKLTWSTKDFDTSNAFSTASGRFTPNIAGKYLIRLQGHCTTATPVYCQVVLYKNGAFVQTNYGRSTAGDVMGQLVTVVDMNGTTDYLEAYIINGGGTTVSGYTTNTRFEGALINAVGSGTGATNLSALGDVQLSGLTDGNVLSYNGSSGKWVNSGALSASSDRITSGTAGIYVSNTGIINLRTGGVTTGYFDTAGLLVAPGISTTTGHGVSSTNGYFSGNVGIGTASPQARLEVSGTIRISTTNPYLAFYAPVNKQTGALFYDNDTLKWHMGHNYNNAGDSNFFLNRNNGYGNFLIDPSAQGVNVGIGTASPQARLDVSGTMRVASGNIRLDNSYVLQAKDSGGTYRTVMIPRYIDNSTYIDAGPNLYLRVNDASTMGISVLTNGHVGIGTASPATTLDVAGPVAANMVYYRDHNGSNGTSSPIGIYNWDGTLSVANLDSSFNYIGMRMSVDYSGNMSIGGTLSQASDARLKKDVATLPDSLEKVAQLRGVSFHWKDPKRDPREQVGLIAQEVQKVYPQLVSTDASGTLSVNYPGMVAPLIQSVKELKDRNDHLEARVEELRAANDNLRTENEKLRADNAQVKIRLERIEALLDGRPVGKEIPLLRRNPETGRLQVGR